MNTLIRMLFDLLRFRLGPQDMPYAPNLLVALIVAAALLEWTGAQISGQHPGAALGEPIALGLIWCALKLQGRESRLVQTGIALWLVRLVILIVILPILAAVGPMPADPQALNPTPLQVVLMSLALPVLIAYVALRVNILRQAFEFSLPRTVFVVLALFFAESMLTALVIGALT